MYGYVIIINIKAQLQFVICNASPGGVKNFHFSMLSRPALGSTQPPIHWVPGALSRG
jgi:hypothetical protein